MVGVAGLHQESLSQEAQGGRSACHFHKLQVLLLGQGLQFEDCALEK